MPSASPLAPGETYLSQYLLDRLAELGVQQLFGVPGDFNLTFLDFVEADNRIGWIGCCNELNAAYAADGYARVQQAQKSRLPGTRGGVQGIGAILTTYGVGELSAVNGVAGAYAERVPILHIVGSPSTKLQSGTNVVHHTLGPGKSGFDVFRKASEDFTCATSDLATASSPAAEVDRVLLRMLATAQPAYISLPTDLVLLPVDATRLQTPLVPIAPVARASGEIVEFVTKEVERLWEAAKDPIIIVDACAIRYGAGHLVEQLVAATGVRWYTTPMGRTIMDEDPSTGFGGTYIAQLCDEETRSAVEKTDLAIMVGAIRSDLNTGLWSSKIKTTDIVELHSNCAQVQFATYPDLGFFDILPALSKTLKRKSILPKELTLAPTSVPIPDGNAEDIIKHNVLWPLVGASLLQENDIIVAEVGTAAFGLLTLPLPKGATIIGQILWGSIGFSLGATLGALLAAQESPIPRRVVVFVGDGSAQLTIQEVATMVRYGLKPTIVLLNNEGYTIERLIHGPTAAYNDISLFNWKNLLPLFTPADADPSTVGSHDVVATRGELTTVLNSKAFSTPDRIKVLEIRLERLDAPASLYRLGEVTRKLNSGA